MLKYVAVAVAAGVALVYFGIVSVPDPDLIGDRVADLEEGAGTAVEMIGDRVADLEEGAGTAVETIQNGSAFEGLTTVVNDTRTTITDQISP